MSYTEVAQSMLEAIAIHSNASMRAQLSKNTKPEDFEVAQKDKGIAVKRMAAALRQLKDLLEEEGD